MMIRTLSFSLLFSLCALLATAQSTRPSESIGFIYNRETAFSLKVHSNRGFVPGIEFGRLKTYYKTTFFNVNCGEIKHPKEYRQSADPSLTRAFRPFVFGKKNSFLALRLGWGKKRYYSEKAKHKGVAVGMSYSFGPSIGIIKPYYLALRRPIEGQPGQSRAAHEKYTADNATIFLDNTRILGASPFTKGIGESTFIPGGNATLAFHMDWGAFDEIVKAIEIGAMLDVYGQKVPILVGEENSPFFLNFFVNLQLGKRR